MTLSRASPEALNQPAELVDYNLFSSHSALAEALAREGASGDLDALTALGARLAARRPAAFGTLPRGSDFAALTARVLSL